MFYIKLNFPINCHLFFVLSILYWYFRGRSIDSYFRKVYLSIQYLGMFCRISGTTKDAYFIQIGKVRNRILKSSYTCLKRFPGPRQYPDDYVLSIN